MSTREVLKILERRGLKMRLKDGEPVLVRPDGVPREKAVTDELLAVLAFHKERIAELLRKESA